MLSSRRGTGSTGLPTNHGWIRTGTADDRDRAGFGPGGGTRVYAIEYGWLDVVRSAQRPDRPPAVTFRLVGEPEPYRSRASSR